MKSAIIDKSFTNMRFKGETDKKTAFMYANALREAGADYIEIDLDSVVKLPKPAYADNYIYRIGGSEEYVIANAFNFSYAVVPLRYSFTIPKISCPVILEINVDGENVFEILKVISANIDFSRLNMIRLVGEFEPDDVPDIISKYRRRVVVPIDICSKNTSLTALSSTISAYRANADAVTVCFGDNDDYTSLEELLIMLSALYKTIVSPDYLEGICKATLISSMFAETKTTNLSVMMRKYTYCPLEIKNIDDFVKSERPQVSKKTKRVSASARVLSTLGIERGLSDKIAEVLEGCGMELSGGENDCDSSQPQ